ncbi:hypothetical protein PpBr36_03607 [Pyricularia pennisetigena]|uniref:hypothetical protein n=1 Tax=Pyricularia pennisetigena TaxID=1578925 RepID=UPI00114FFE08|nr:hypothetical protein PpBr36_03607 [Pyricularia pennisetigena]TLS31392.1 hypothetical protein PpBr36_03607 [Pyricularia pennisetigena]
MPPIPIYSKSPINASKASGVTPQTVAPSDDSKEKQSQGPAASATTNYIPTKTAAYAAPQPGATPTIPTATAPSGSNPYAPAPTAGLGGSASPPQPQPGAVPAPPGGIAASVTGTGLPPPPKAGETYQPPAPAPATTAAPQYPPPQMFMAAPTAPYPQQQRGTSTTAGPPPAFGAPATQLPGASVDIFSHPAGYQQNANASSYAGQSRSDNYGGGLGGTSHDDQGEGVWDSAKKYMAAAGTKLSEAESEVWKRINKNQ